MIVVGTIKTFMCSLMQLRAAQYGKNNYITIIFTVLQL